MNGFRQCFWVCFSIFLRSHFTRINLEFNEKIIWAIFLTSVDKLSLITFLTVGWRTDWRYSEPSSRLHSVRKVLAKLLFRNNVCGDAGYLLASQSWSRYWFYSLLVWWPTVWNLWGNHEPVILENWQTLFVLWTVYRMPLPALHNLPLEQWQTMQGLFGNSVAPESGRCSYNSSTVMNLEYLLITADFNFLVCWAKCLENFENFQTMYWNVSLNIVNSNKLFHTCFPLQYAHTKPLPPPTPCLCGSVSCRFAFVMYKVSPFAKDNPASRLNKSDN